MNSSGANKILDKRFNILGYEQYLIDRKEKKFNKMAMTEVMNADMIIAISGEERYYATCTTALDTGKEGYKKLGLENIIYIYAHSYKSFITVANDDMNEEDFSTLMRDLHKEYELSNSTQIGFGGATRFAIVYGDDLVNRAKSAFFLYAERQINGIMVTDEKERITEERTQELKVFDMLNYAIKNNTVVPFYQGIHNNQTGKIEKYEALMRVYDAEGKLYTPWFFLETSKKLKLYLQLSKIVLDKALTDFKDKKSMVSLNISLFDIQSASFREWFLERIKQHSDPSKVIIEFVETENYNKDVDFKQFLNAVRAVGCKIAIDDFGVGYATYTSIMSLRPDIIKIDGDIIKNLVKTRESNLIVDAICYMARLIYAEVTAEFVADGATQKLVLDNKIRSSQGYYFAKPERFEDLHIE